MTKCDRFHLSRYLSEFVGTAILVCSVKMLVATANDFAALFIGLTLTMVVYLYGYNSLGMFNPAVTVGQAIRSSETFKLKQVDQWLMYLIAQFTGGIAGGFFAGAAGGTAQDQAGFVYVYANDDDYLMTECFIAELFFTFLLVAVNIHSATDKRHEGNQYYGLAIGGVLAFAVFCIGPITGSAVNPAVWLGTVMSAWYYKDDDVDMINNDKTWIYPAAEFTAAIIAGMWFNVVYGGKAANGQISEQSSEDLQQEQGDDEEKQRVLEIREKKPKSDL